MQRLRPLALLALAGLSVGIAQAAETAAETQAAEVSPETAVNQPAIDVLQLDNDSVRSIARERAYAVVAAREDLAASVSGKSADLSPSGRRSMVPWAGGAMASARVLARVLVSAIATAPALH